MEMLGIKPGRMLKGESEPGPRRYCYSYDDEGRVIHVVKYGKLIGPADNRDWIRSDEFYEYFDGFVMRYVYDDTFREDPDSEITRIVKFAIVDDKNSVAFQIEKMIWNIRRRFILGLPLEVSKYYCSLARRPFPGSRT
ncbi:hypothetical protein [Burkholderia cepacia]|uniref:hypothetical protein n=1 Tax=Burkholderia cepacia TaxID=292 RepID=UPI00299066F6|nr:hypothetical protein [Burkholderia cepacia]MDW9247078.1 hypothetical protein [Burkholderia cepacia]